MKHVDYADLTRTVVSLTTGEDDTVALMATLACEAHNADDRFDWTGQVQLVPDVHAFPGHIACASSTRSEIVLPVVNSEGKLLGVFDIDSNQPDAFTQADADAMTAILAQAFANAT